MSLYGKIGIAGRTLKARLEQLKVAEDIASTVLNSVPPENRDPKDKTFVETMVRYFVENRSAISGSAALTTIQAAGFDDLDAVVGAVEAVAEAVSMTIKVGKEEEEKFAKPAETTSKRAKDMFPPDYKFKGTKVEDYDEVIKFINPRNFNAEKAEEEWLTAIMMTVAYQGFDWRHTLKLFVTRGKENGFAKEVIQKHMKVLVAITVERGPAFFKRENRWNGISEEMKENLKALKNSYGIVTKSGQLTKDDISLSRIVALVPTYVSDVMIHSKKVPIANHVSPNIHDAVKFPGAAAFIPRDDNDTFEAWYTWYEAFSRVINPGGVNPNLKKFATAIWNSDLFDNNDDRRKLWAKYNQPYPKK